MRVAALATLALVAAACATTPVAPAPVDTPTGPPPEVLDGDHLCRAVAALEDATSHAGLSSLRLAADRKRAGDPHDEFVYLMAVPRLEERFSAAHERSVANPKSAIGPLGECLVYASWKIPDQAAAPCKRAAELLGPASAVVDVARADLAQRRGDVAAAGKGLDDALAKTPGCASALLARARFAAAGNDVVATRAAWQAAADAWPACFSCQLELGRLVEASEGRVAAAPFFERALQIVPDHAETLKRLAAAVAGVDDARALAAYEAALSAGVKDFATYLAAARLAFAVGSPEALDRALEHARNASAIAKTDVDARRLLLQIAQKKGDGALVVAHAKAVVELVSDDVPARVALARAAMRTDAIVDAVTHFDVAVRHLDAGDASLPAADVTSVRAESDGLLKKLAADKPAKGTVNAVVSTVQRSVQRVFKERLALKPTLHGTVTVAVQTGATGVVDDVQVVADGVGDPWVAGSIVANLRRANISGGARRYSFDLELR